MVRVTRADRPAATQILLVLVLAWAGAGCGGSNPDNSGPQDGGTPGGDIVGGELLAWDQTAPSFTDLPFYTFTLYVDGTRATVLADIRCQDNQGPQGFTCSAPLPRLMSGRRTLQVTATVGGQESPLSPPLSVTAR